MLQGYNNGHDKINLSVILFSKILQMTTVIITVIRKVMESNAAYCDEP